MISLSRVQLFSRSLALASLVAMAGTPAQTAVAADSVSIDVGDGYVIKTNGEPLRIALFSIGTNNSYLEAQNDEARKAAAELGIELDIFDGGFNSAKQIDQMQVALASGKYNAWIVQAASGDAVCNIASKQAPAANILVENMLVSMCGRDLNSGEDIWQPGTLNYVGGNETVAAWEELWKKAVADNPGPQKVGIMVGPPLLNITRAFMKAKENIAPDNWEIIEPVYTDYSVPDSQQKAVPLVQANPDMTILMSAYTNITKGGVAALRSADRLGKVKIYEGGGTETGLKYIKDGTTQAMLARYSRAPVRYAINALVDAWAGKPVPRFTPNDGHPDEAGRIPGSAVFLVTKENAESYHPEND